MDERTIPYFVHEGDMMRMERANKRLWIALLIMIVAFIGSNAGWLFYESQFEDVVTTVEAEQETDDGGNNYIVGGNYNGEPESESNN